ncbi:MAG: hypothetical protein ACOCXQ_04225 [Patescibacteria group bacterium]
MQTLILGRNSGYNPAVDYLSSLGLSILDELVALVCTGDKDAIDILHLAFGDCDVIRLRHSMIEPYDTVFRIHDASKELLVDYGNEFRYLPYPPGICYFLRTSGQRPQVAEQVQRNFVYAAGQIPYVPETKFFGNPKAYLQWLTDEIRSINGVISKTYPKMGLTFPIGGSKPVIDLLWQLIVVADNHLCNHPDNCMIMDSHGIEIRVDPYNVLVEYFFGDLWESFVYVIDTNDFTMG